MKSFEEFLNENESFSSVKKGETVPVEFIIMKGSPVYNVESKNDSWYSDHVKCECFSFLMGGDMMMIAKWNGEKWQCS
jgi:hypothetical protein